MIGTLRIGLTESRNREIMLEVGICLGMAITAVILIIVVTISDRNAIAKQQHIKAIRQIAKTKRHLRIVRK